MGDDRLSKLSDEISRVIGPDPRQIRYLDDLVPTEKRQADYNALAMRDLYARQGKNIVAVIKARVEQLEAKLQDGETLIVYCDGGRDRIQVREMDFPTWNLAVLIGLDEHGDETHRIENVQDVKLTCKVVKSLEKAARIGFVFPSKDTPAK